MELSEDSATRHASFKSPSDIALPKAVSSFSGLTEALWKKITRSTAMAAAISDSAPIIHMMLPP